MVLLTMIGRANDGLVLAASVNGTDFGQKNSQDYQNQAKTILKRLSGPLPTKMAIDSDPYVFLILIENGICYLCLCDKTFHKKSAFAYLEDLATEFHRLYSARMLTVTRPYSFIEFDTYVQAAWKKMNTTRSRRNIHMLSNDLQDVQRIMVQNIGDVLQRGVAISDLDSKASNLSLMSKNYKKGASLLNSRAMYAKVAFGSIILACIFLYFWVL